MRNRIRNLAINCLIATYVVSIYSPAQAEIFDLGGMYTFHYHDGRYADWGDYALHGAHIAIEEVNSSGLLGDDQIRLTAENTIDYHCWPENAALMAATLMQKDILVITGADCSGPAVEIAKIAEQYEIPVISNGANASMLTSTKEFPWFVRVVTPSETYEGYLIDVAARFGVTEIGFFHTTDAWGLGARQVIHQYANEHGINIAKEYGFPRDTNYETIEQYIAEAKNSGIRHIVIAGPTPDTVTVFRALHALDMNQPGNTFYAAEMISADERREAVNGSLGYFAPMAMLPQSKIQQEFRRTLESRLNRPVDPNSKAFFYGALSYDHILAVANSIKAIKEDGQKVSRANMIDYLRLVDFDGATGRVSIAPGTNDRANMPVQIFNSHGYKADGKTVNFVSVGSIDPNTGELVLDESAILWPGATKVSPEKIQNN